MKLVFIVNGEDALVDASGDESLELAKRRALTLSRNTGRPPADWELYDIVGYRVPDDEASKPIHDLGLRDGARFFLSLGVGAGGAVVQLGR